MHCWGNTTHFNCTHNWRTETPIVTHLIAAPVPWPESIEQFHPCIREQPASDLNFCVGNFFYFTPSKYSTKNRLEYHPHFVSVSCRISSYISTSIYAVILWNLPNQVPLVRTTAWYIPMSAEKMGNLCIGVMAFLGCFHIICSLFPMSAEHVASLNQIMSYSRYPPMVTVL